MKYTISRLKKEFPNDITCLEYIFNKKFGQAFTCPKCKHKKSKFHRVSKRKCYSCQWCSFQIHPLKGTIFEKSSTPLNLWFFAIFLMSQSKNGVSAKEIERHVGVTYKTAWRMAKEIRKLMGQDPKKDIGVFEIDETYVGGADRNKHMSKRKHKRGRGTDKTPVVGIAKRCGGVYAKTVADTTRSSVMPLIRQQVELDSIVMTDEFSVYDTLKHRYTHGTVNHGKKEYARGVVHVNTIEGFWSQLKRSISGTYHSVSPKYLQRYVDEIAYHYNHRHSPLPIFLHLLSEMVK